MKSKLVMGFRVAKTNQGNVYILKRKGAYCLSKFQNLASLDDMLFLNNQCWFSSIKEIENIFEKEYVITS